MAIPAAETEDQLEEIEDLLDTWLDVLGVRALEETVERLRRRKASDQKPSRPHEQG